MSEWFIKNKKYKDIFVSKKYTFSASKYSEENMIRCIEYIKFKNSIYYNITHTYLLQLYSYYNTL